MTQGPRLRVVPRAQPGRRHPLDAWEQAMVEVPNVQARPWSAPRERWILRGLIGVCVVVGLISWMLW